MKKRLLIKEFCNICGKTKDETYTKRLVYDHDHNTGFIRGVLCDLCNSWIRFYEEVKTYNPPDPSVIYTNRVIVWMQEFKDRIESHLKCNTGILYKNKCPH